MARDPQLALLADAHVEQTLHTASASGPDAKNPHLIPPADDLASAELEVERLIAIICEDERQT